MSPKKFSSKLYEKNNSFLGIRGSSQVTLDQTLARLESLTNSDACKAFADDNVKSDILHKAFIDLFSEDDQDSDGAPRFSLTPNVIEEISKLADSDLPKYLYQRYRYEIFPLTRTLDEFPPYLQIEPASVCNYRCVFCYQTDSEFTDKNNGHMGFMSLDLFKLIIDQAKGNIDFISLASRGEPLLCPDIVEMLAYTRGKFLNLKMNTNASVLNEAKSHAILQSGIQTLVFSADAAQEPLYSAFRVNGDLERVLKNIRQFNRIKEEHYPHSKLITRVSGVKFDDRQNLDDMESVWGELVDQIAFVDYNPWENVYENAPNSITTPCSDLWRRMFIWWDGKVNPCDVDYKSTLSPGCIDRSTTISDLWNSTYYAALRNSHETNGRITDNPCNKCVVV